MSPIEGVRRIPLFALLGSTALGMAFLSPASSGSFRAEYNETYPAKALAKIQTLAEPRIFTTDEWGDYLIYKRYPQLKVYVDGRCDFYGETFANNYLDVLSVKHGWKEDLASHGVDTVLLPVDLPMAGALKESAQWRVIYDDGVAIMFALDGKQHPKDPKDSTSWTNPLVSKQQLRGAEMTVDRQSPHIQRRYEK